MPPNDVWTIAIGVVFLAAMVYAGSREETAFMVPAAIGASMVVALDAIAGFPRPKYTVIVVVFFLLMGGIRTWKERDPAAG